MSLFELPVEAVDSSAPLEARVRAKYAKWKPAFLQCRQLRAEIPSSREADEPTLVLAVPFLTVTGKHALLGSRRSI